MSQAASTSELRARLALLLAALLWSSAYIVMKLVLEHFHPLSMIAVRMLTAALCFLLFIPYFRQRVVYVKGDWKWFALMALAEPCLYFVFETYALVYTSASQAGMVAAVLPVFVAIGATTFLKERLSAQGWIGAALAIAGVAGLSLGAEGTEKSPDPLLGNLLELAAMCFAAVYSICARRLARNYDPWFITAAQAWIGTLFFLPALFIPGMGLPDSAPPLAWAGIVYMGAVVSIGAYGMYNLGLSRMKAGSAAIYINLIPVFAVFMGFVFLNEVLSARQYLACGVVLAGLYISRRG